MADVKISQLPDASLPLTGAEVFPLVQNNVTVKTSISSAVSANINNFVGNGAEVNFDLSLAPGNINTVNIFISGVYQNKSSYSLVDKTISFSEAPPYNSIIEVAYL